MKTFHNVVNAIICCEKEAKRIGQKRTDCVRDLYDEKTKQRLIVLFTSDVMKKRMFKTLAYTPPDLSPRFTCKVNLVVVLVVYYVET